MSPIRAISWSEDNVEPLNGHASRLLINAALVSLSRQKRLSSADQPTPFLNGKQIAHTADVLGGTLRREDDTEMDKQS